MLVKCILLSFWKINSKQALRFIIIVILVSIINFSFLLIEDNKLSIK